MTFVQEELSIASYSTASTLVRQFAALGLLEEITGQQRNRRYRYTDYLALFAEGVDDADDQAPAQRTTTE